VARKAPDSHGILHVEVIDRRHSDVGGLRTQDARTSRTSRR